jgi:hypothetical protein
MEEANCKLGRWILRLKNLERAKSIVDPKDGGW